MLPCLRSAFLLSLSYCTFKSPPDFIERYGPLDFFFQSFPWIPLFVIRFCCTGSFQFFTHITVLWLLFLVGSTVHKILHGIMLLQLNLEISCPDWIYDIHHLFTEIQGCSKASTFPFSCRTKTGWHRRKMRRKTAWKRSKIVDLLWQKRGIKPKSFAKSMAVAHVFPETWLYSGLASFNSTLSPGVRLKRIVTWSQLFGWYEALPVFHRLAWWI